MDDYQLSVAAKEWRECLDSDERVGPYRANCILDILRFVGENAAHYLADRLQQGVTTRSLTSEERSGVARYAVMYGVLRGEFATTAHGA